ncbi:MAG: type II toxin-antitoxin system MqsA family antitoxin [Treponema sp.]|nr:type II toxin-antitoxin system MqsA family antitoxin [Treponema sp.]
MTCFMCKGTVHGGFSTFSTDMSGCVIVIKNVPSSICEQCGETSYSDDVARQIEQIVNNMSGLAKTEIAVVNYSGIAA